MLSLIVKKRKKEIIDTQLRNKMDKCGNPPNNANII